MQIVIFYFKVKNCLHFLGYYSVGRVCGLIYYSSIISFATPVFRANSDNYQNFSSGYCYFSFLNRTTAGVKAVQIRANIDPRSKFASRYRNPLKEIKRLFKPTRDR